MYCWYGALGMGLRGQVGPWAGPGRMACCYSNKIAGSQVHLRSLSEISQIDLTQLRSTQHHSGQTKYTDILGAST